MQEIQKSNSCWSYFKSKIIYCNNKTSKKAVIPYLSHIDDRAKAIGAVNTIVNRNGQLFGYNIILE
mgnify:CR=1 FL=1